MRCSNVISVFVTVVVALVVAGPAGAQTVYSESFDTNAVDNAAFDAAYSGWSDVGTTTTGSAGTDTGRIVSNGQLRTTQIETGTANTMNAAGLFRTITGMTSGLVHTYTWQMGGDGLTAGSVNQHLLIDGVAVQFHPGIDYYRTSAVGPRGGVTLWMISELWGRMHPMMGP